MRLKLISGTIVATLFALTCTFPLSTIHATTENSVDGTALSDAVCPIVYPVDQSSSDRGYHYLFYGNSFFVNEKGYLITAAHVLSQLHGGQAYILLSDPSGRSRFVRADPVIVDRSHDVAILRATPNPFDGPHTVRYLPISSDWVVESQDILVASTRPAKPLDAYSLDDAVADRWSGEVFDFAFSQLEKGRGDTELFHFNHQVRLGQSGAPVVASGSHEVVGLIEGQCLRPTSASIPRAAEPGVPGVGAAVPMHYAIALLQQKNIVAHNFWRFEFLEPTGGANHCFFATHSPFAGGVLFPVSSNFWGRGGARFSDRQSWKAHANTCRAWDHPFSGKGPCRGANLEFQPCNH